MGISIAAGGHASLAPVGRSRRLQQAVHDIRTPLTTIVQSVDALLEIPDDNSMRARHIFELLRRNVLFMGEVLEASAQRTDAPRQEFDLIALARETAELIEPVLAARGQSVRIDASRRVLRVSADCGRIARALLNLLDNASKYGPRGDSLTVTIRRRRAGTVVSVSDHGPGIPKGDRHAIFRAFYRAGEPQHAGHKGIGLGLAEVRDVAESHGGAVGVSCTEGTTRVWFYIADVASDVSER